MPARIDQPRHDHRHRERLGLRSRQRQADVWRAEGVEDAQLAADSDYAVARERLRGAERSAVARRLHRDE